LDRLNPLLTDTRCFFEIRFDQIPSSALYFRSDAIEFPKQYLYALLACVRASCITRPTILRFMAKVKVGKVVGVHALKAYHFIKRAILTDVLLLL
jgi:hypothetical protein